MRSSRARFSLLVIAGLVLALGAAASGAQPATRSGGVTISMLVNSVVQPGYALLIPNFERVYPNITVNATFAATNSLWYQEETTELGAGNAPDLLGTEPGCGTPVSVCGLVKGGDLAPMVKAPWTKRSLPLVTSLSKSNGALYAYETALAISGMFVNSDLFAKLGLKIPQTFSQLLTVCQKAQADGTAALLLSGANGGSLAGLIEQLATATVYGPDPQWNAQRKAGSVTFDGTPGWHQALQEFVEMNGAGCFQPGAAGTTSVGPLFATGQGLMWPTLSIGKGQIDPLNPNFTYSFAPFPGGTAPSQTLTYVHLGTALSVNAHSSAANQAAAQTFVDFVARPAQNALYAQTIGDLTQYEFLKQQLPSFMSSFAPVFRNKEYVMDPTATWWNGNILLALEQSGIGLITGQSTIDSVLSAMDAAWQQGPS